MNNTVLVISDLPPTLCTGFPSSFAKDSVQMFLVLHFRSFLYYSAFSVSWLMTRLNMCFFCMTKNMVAWFWNRILYVGVDFSSEIVLILFALNFRGGSRGGIAGFWKISVCSIFGGWSGMTSFAPLRGILSGLRYLFVVLTCTRTCCKHSMKLAEEILKLVE